MIEAKAFRALITTYSLFKSKWLSTNIKLALLKAPMRSVMTYVCPAWEFAADTPLLNLQRLKHMVLRTIGNISQAHAGRWNPELSIFRTFTII
jgi:hypothetical protein